MKQEHSIAALQSAEQKTVGMAIIIDRSRVLTCAHVVNSALGLPQNSVPSPAEPVWIAFPLVTGSRPLRASVSRWYPMSDDSGTAGSAIHDLAVLTTEEEIPLAAGTAVFAEHREGASVKSYGFRSKTDASQCILVHPDGEWAEGIIMGPVAHGQVQLDGVRETGIFLQPGFSGAGVFDIQQRCVVGLVVTTNRDPAERVARMIPYAVLRGVASASAPPEQNVCIAAIVSQYERTHRDASPDTLRAHIHSYTCWVAERYGTIELRGIRQDGQQVLHLDLGKVYVPLEADAYVPMPSVGGRPSGPVAKPIELNEMLNVGNRIILTGGPGSGKTTVLLHTVCTLATAISTDRPTLAASALGLTQELPIPVLVPLSAYAAYVRKLDASGTAISSDSYTLASFICSYLKQHHSYCGLPADFFHNLLLTGEGILLCLDGLDEVSNDAERARVRQAVEELVTGRESMRVIVTCRTAAYKGRTALGRSFREVRVKPLENKHIIQLVLHAYRHLYDANTPLCCAKVKELLAAVASIEEERQLRLGPEAQRLIDSPLLVRLLIVVHHNNNHVPRRRAELYLLASDAMLLPHYGPDEEVIDAIGRSVGGADQAHRKLIQFIAFKMHDQGRQAGREIAQDDLRALIESMPDFAPLVRDFIAMTRLRGTLMEERFEQYRFLHLAFQEFLAAQYLADSLLAKSGIEGIIAFLLDSNRITDSWWREVILLLIGYLSYKSPKQAEQCIRKLGSVESLGAFASEQSLAASELAATGLLEWGQGPRSLAELVHARLREAFSDKRRDSLSRARAIFRITVGRALALLGDTRPEVMDIDQLHLCLIPAGYVLIGSDQPPTGTDPDRSLCLRMEQPRHTVNIPYDFWIGRYPVTNAQYRVFFNEGGYDEPAFWTEAEVLGLWRPGSIRRWFWVGQELRNAWETGPHDYGAPFNLPNHPVVGVCWYEDLAFMRWLTVRWETKGFIPANFTLCFPSEPEWEKAVRGGAKLLLEPCIRPAAWLTASENPQPLRDNPSPARAYPWEGPFDPQVINARETDIGTTNPVGSFPASVSVYGAEEMCGGVWEWTRSLFGKQRIGTHAASLEWDHLFRYPYTASDGREDLASEASWLRVARGGAFFIEGAYTRCAFRDFGSPSFRFRWDGFRVALVPRSVLSSVHAEAPALP